MNTLRQLLGREKVDVAAKLPRQVIAHDAVDELRYEDICEESRTFRQTTVEDAPTVVAKAAPEPVDTLSATPEEVEAYREAVQEYRAAEREAKPYTSWDELIADVYYSYHTLDTPDILDKVDAGVELHRKIMEQVLAQDEHHEARDITRGDDILSAYATMRFTDKLREVLGDELEAQMREAQELEEARKEVEETTVLIEEIVPPGPEGEGGGATGGGTTGTTGTPGGNGAGPAPKTELSEKAKKQLEELEEQRAEAQARAEERAEPKPMDADAARGIAEAAQAGDEAAQEAQHRPKFGAGIGTGAGEPTYTSPEQALELTRRWAEDAELREMCELMGRGVREFRYKRGKRIEGGNDEIVDVRHGDDLRRTIPAEQALLSDPATEDDFMARYVDRELLEYQTVGEENAGRGPVVIVLDGSGSMSGERNIYARAVALTVLQNTRIEKRDFALIEFSAGGQVKEWLFKARDPLMGEDVLDMASHFFGGGTVPIIGIQKAHALMKAAPAFRKADIVLVGDGDGAWGTEDERLRDELREMGVRFFGIAIGGSWAYIEKYCDYVVDVHDFQLTEPGQAVSDLAERMS